MDPSGSEQGGDSEQGRSACDLEELDRTGDKFEKDAIGVARAANEKLHEFVSAQHGDNDDEATRKWLGFLQNGAAQGVPTFTPLCQRLMRALTPEEKAEYDKLGKGYAAKALWRQKWCQSKYDTVVKEKRHVDSWSVEDTSIGEYLSLSCIIKKEGGRHCPKAHEAARKYILRCCLLGGRWLAWNDMTERYDYLYITKGRREVFARCWQLMKLEVSKDKPKQQHASGAATLEPADAALAASREPETPDKALAPTKEVANDAGGEAKACSTDAGRGVVRPKRAAARGSGRGNGVKRAASGSNMNAKLAPKCKKVQSDFQVRVAQAAATKNSFLIVTGQAAQIKKNIDVAGEWSWARTSEISGKLHDLTQVVFTCLGSCGEIGRSFVSGCSVEDLVQEHGEDSVQDALNTVVSKLDIDLEALRVNLDKIAAMHSIMIRT